MAEHNELGKRGEALASEYLKEKGYTILAKNWRWQNNEIDIIAQQNNLIIFVEVKTRGTAYFGHPEVFVTKAQQKLYIKLANAYVLQHNCSQEVRFDIVSALLTSSQCKMNHIEGAFSIIL